MTGRMHPASPGRLGPPPTGEPEPLPKEVGESAEVAVNFVPDEFGIKVAAVLGEASVVVEHAWDAAEEAATLVQALPNILVAVQAALDSQEEA